MTGYKGVKKREGYAVIFSETAKMRISEDKCPSCGKQKTEWLRSTRWRCCSVECTERFWKEFILVKSWSDLRAKCFERDGWRCVKCGNQPTRKDYYPNHWVPISEIQFKEYFQKSKLFAGFGTEMRGNERALYAATAEPCELVADHIVPIALGGEEWDIQNLQTLCVACNKAKTRVDQGRIAELRAVVRKQGNGQSLLPVVVDNE